VSDVYTVHATQYQCMLIRATMAIQKINKPSPNEASSKLQRIYITAISDKDYKRNGKVNWDVTGNHTNYHEAKEEGDKVNEVNTKTH